MRRGFSSAVFAIAIVAGAGQALGATVGDVVSMRRLTEQEYRNSIADIFGKEIVVQGVFEPVATYSRWRELGRQVRKGSKAKVVLAPVMVSRDAKDGNGNIVVGDDGKPGRRQVLVGFSDSRTVFGYSDTDGDELPPVELPGWETDVALATLGVDRVPFDMINGNAQGIFV